MAFSRSQFRIPHRNGRQTLATRWKLRLHSSAFLPFFYPAETKSSADKQGYSISIFELKQIAEKAPRHFVIPSGARNLSFFLWAYTQERFLASLGMTKLTTFLAVCQSDLRRSGKINCSQIIFTTPPNRN